MPIFTSGGNASTDGHAGVTLSYNHLNLPQTATNAGLSLTYTYDAMGRKLKKVSNTTGTTEYVDGIQYTNGSIDFIQTAEGIARKNGGTCLPDRRATTLCGYCSATIIHLLFIVF